MDYPLVLDIWSGSHREAGNHKEEAMEEKRGFHPIIVVASGLFFACIIYLSTKLHFMTPLVGGIALLAFVAFPHYLCLKRSLDEGNNVGAIVLMGFFSFWVVLGTCLIIVSQGGMTIDELNRSLMPIEAGLAAVVLFFLRFYREKEHLCVTLSILGCVLAVLAVSKFVMFYVNKEVGGVIENSTLVSIAILTGFLVWMELRLMAEEAKERAEEAKKKAAQPA